MAARAAPTFPRRVRSRTIDAGGTAGKGWARNGERGKRGVGMDADDPGAAQAPAAGERVGWGELWRWFAPWLGGAGLVALCLLGLFVASRAADDATYAGGFAAAAIAVVALAWRIRGGFQGRRGGALLVEDSDALVVLVAVLVVLGLLGLFLAARGEEPMVIYGGYGLFIGALIMISWNVKHYFDRLGR